jgi:hypothetical protein
MMRARLILVRRRGGGSRATVVGVHAVRGHRVLIDALLPRAAVVRVKSALVSGRDTRRSPAFGGARARLSIR